MDRYIKSQALIEAKMNIQKFLKDNKLNPQKNYSDHPIYGKRFRELLLLLNKERDKVAIIYPNTDIKNLKKYVKRTIRRTGRLLH